MGVEHKLICVSLGMCAGIGVRTLLTRWNGHMEHEREIKAFSNISYKFPNSSKRCDWLGSRQILHPEGLT